MTAAAHQSSFLSASQLEEMRLQGVKCHERKGESTCTTMLRLLFNHRYMYEGDVRKHNPYDIPPANLIIVELSCLCVRTPRGGGPWNGSL